MQIELLGSVQSKVIDFLKNFHELPVLYSRYINKSTIDTIYLTYKDLVLKEGYSIVVPTSYNPNECKFTELSWKTIQQISNILSIDRFFIYAFFCAVVNLVKSNKISASNLNPKLIADKFDIKEEYKDIRKSMKILIPVALGIAGLFALGYVKK